MREIRRAGQFKRDYKRELRGPYGKTLPQDLAKVIEALATDVALESRHVDHPLRGHWRGYRDCHVRPDLILIYAKPDSRTLELVRLGSHSELF